MLTLWIIAQKHRATLRLRYHRPALHRLRFANVLCAALLGQSPALAQTPTSSEPRRVVLIANASERAAATELGRTLGELVAAYHAVVLVRDPGDAPELDAAVTLQLTRQGRGLSLSYELRRIDARGRASALRVLTAIRGALESPERDPIDEDDPSPRASAPRASVRRSEMPIHTVFYDVSRPARAQTQQSRPRVVARTRAIEVGLVGFSPIGTGVFWGASLRLSGRVAGTARSGAWIAVEAVLLGAQTLSLGGAPARVAQLPLFFDAGWTARYGALAASLGGSFAALVTRVGDQTNNSTLAFGAGVSLELGARLGGVLLGARLRGLCIGNTTLVRGEGLPSASIGPFFAAGELVLRIGL